MILPTACLVPKIKEDTNYRIVRFVLSIIRQVSITPLLLNKMFENNSTRKEVESIPDADI